MNENIMNENIERVAQALKNAGFDYKEALKGLEVLTDLHIELECLNSSNYREYKCFDDLGNQYSWGETLIDKVNKINKKYNIVDKELKIHRSQKLTLTTRTMCWRNISKSNMTHPKDSRKDSFQKCATMSMIYGATVLKMKVEKSVISLMKSTKNTRQNFNK